jgi:hypothetical protein
MDGNDNMIPGETPQDTANTTPNVAPKKRMRHEKTTTQKPRTTEELQNISPEKMTPKELIIMVKALREMTAQLSQQAAAYEGNAKSAYEQARDLQARYDDLRVRLNSTISFIKQTLAVCNTTVVLATNKLEG